MRINKSSIDCCGCSACALKCPKQAISMEPDDLGFLYPSVDDAKCIDCGLCVKVCGFHSSNNSKHSSVKLVYAARLKDEALLKKSQSGGAFWALACTVIESGGIVYGAALHKDFTVSHIRTTSISEMECLRGSKYVQSNIDKTYTQVKTDLSNCKMVLFSGTPCQISGLLNYLGEKMYSNLITVDLLCHGVPSIFIWLDYIKWIEYNYKSKVTACIFRDKSYGWGTHFETFYLNNGQRIKKRMFRDMFYRHYILRDSCHHCPFTNLNRISDITICDYWGWQHESYLFYDNKGLSLILINTFKGEKLFNTAKISMDYEKNSSIKHIQPQMKAPAPRPKNKDQFVSDYNDKGFDYVVHKYSIIGLRYNIRVAIMGSITILNKIIWHINFFRKWLSV